jgi:hypothetical protein
MDIELLQALINNPKTKIGIAILGLLITSYNYDEINKIEIYEIPASNILLTVIGLNIAHGVFQGFRFFPNLNAIGNQIIELAPEQDLMADNLDSRTLITRMAG